MCPVDTFCILRLISNRAALKTKTNISHAKQHYALALFIYVSLFSGIKQSVPFLLEEFCSIMSHRERWAAHTTDMYMQNKDAVMPTEQNHREVSQVINTCFIY